MLALIDQRRRGWTLEFSNVVPTAVNFLRNIAPWLRHDFAYHGMGEVRKNILRKLTVWLCRLSRGGKRSPEPDISVILDLSRYAPDRHDLFRVLYAALLAYRPKNYRGRVVVFRAAAQPIFRLWDEPGLGWRELVEPEPDVRVVPVACCGKVPGPVRSAIRSQVAKGAPEVPVWLDFGDTMKGMFGLAAGEPNVVVFDAAGRLRLKITGTPDRAALEKLGQTVEALRYEAAGVR